MKLDNISKSQAVASISKILEAVESGELDSTPAIAAALEAARAGLEAKSIEI
jgi:hypothetical protein